MRENIQKLICLNGKRCLVGEAVTLTFLTLFKYLELRFSRVTRLLGTFLFITQTVSVAPVS